MSAPPKGLLCHEVAREFASVFTDPQPTQYDLNFTIFRVPVRVHPLFWLITILLGATGGEFRLGQVAIWVVAVFVSILVHEFGHVLAFQYYGRPARVVLYSFGGLAIADRPSWSYTEYGQSDDDTSRSGIVIALAGPVAGFLLAALILLCIRLLGHEVVFVPDLIPVDFEGFASKNVNDLLWDMLQINILWGAINLLPIFPLDGGQVSRHVFQVFDPSRGLEKSLLLSMVVAGAMALFALMRFKGFFTALMFGSLAYTSFNAYQQIAGRFRGHDW